VCLCISVYRACVILARYIAECRSPGIGSTGIPGTVAERVFPGEGESSSTSPPLPPGGGSGSAGEIYRFTFRGGRPAVILHFVEESDVKYIYGRAATLPFPLPTVHRFRVRYIIIRAEMDDFPQ